MQNPYADHLASVIQEKINDNRAETRLMKEQLQELESQLPTLRELNAPPEMISAVEACIEMALQRIAKLDQQIIEAQQRLDALK